MSHNPPHSIATPGGPIFEVRDLPGAQTCFQDYDAVISLLDPGMAVAFPPHPFHRVFAIRDVATAQGASLEVIREILDLDFSQAKRVLVHCEVGVSRSPAMAMLLAARWGADDEAILRGMDWARACPNRRILELGEVILGVPGRLMALVEAGHVRGSGNATKDSGGKTGTKPRKGSEGCGTCGKRLSKKTRHQAELLNRFLAVLLPDKRVEAIALCPACLAQTLDHAPAAFGTARWRSTLATHAAAYLAHFLGEASRDQVETLCASQLIFLNLLNSASDEDLRAAQRQAERSLLVLLEGTQPARPEEETPARHRIQLPSDRVLDVRGLPEARQIYRDYDAVISLQDPWAEVHWESHPKHWIFKVRDIEGEDEHAPSLDLVRQILESDLDGVQRLLVHCHEGFSRSTATAILLATKLGARRDDILDGIDWTHAYPNRRILSYGEAILGTAGVLSELVDEGLRRGGWM